MRECVESEYVQGVVCLQKVCERVFLRGAWGVCIERVREGVCIEGV